MYDVSQQLFLTLSCHKMLSLYVNLVIQHE